jgi:tRNA(fMet)-specific endonuclease VapC
MSWMMDTSVAIYLRDGQGEIVERVAALGGQPVISIITHVELEGGVYRDPAQTTRRRARLNALLDTIIVLPFGQEAARAYAGILSLTGFSRARILDRMIAAQAISMRLRLMTTNVADFRDIADLQLEDWSLPKGP